MPRSLMSFDRGAFLGGYIRIRILRVLHLQLAQSPPPFFAHDIQSAQSNVFSGLIMGVIVLNALAIALETNRTLRQVGGGDPEQHTPNGAENPVCCARTRARLLYSPSYCRQEHERVFAAADLVFLTLYTIEFLLHMFAAPVRYLRNTYNRFDVLVLFLSYAQFVFIEVGKQEEEGVKGGERELGVAASRARWVGV